MIITEIQYFFSKIIRFQAIFKDTVEFTCALEFKISSQRILCFHGLRIFMQFVQFLFWFLYFFVKFTKFSHHVHNLFIIGWYTLNTVKEEIRLPDNKAYKINFFIIAQAPKGVWALLILWGFSCHPITVLTIKKNLACEILRLRRVAFATYFITAAVRSLRSIFNS